jgi:hypothetical protein
MSEAIEKPVIPEQIELSEDQIFIFENLFEDLDSFLKRRSELNQTAQQISAAVQSNDSDLMGTGKAIQKMVEVILKQKSIVAQFGDYKWDREKKLLFLDKNRIKQ